MTGRGGDLDRLTPAVLRRRGTVKWTRYDPDVLALWVAEMDLPTAPVVLAAVRDAVAREELGYPRGDSANGLPEATASWLATRYGWHVDPARVHTLPDVLKGVELAIEQYSPAGSAVILPTPAYMPFFDVPPIVGRPIVEAPVAVADGRYVLDLDAVDRAFAAGAGTLVLCQPYNPLGRSFTREELLAVCAVVTRHGGRVVADEVHGPLTYGDAYVPYASVSAEAAGHAVSLTSASKAWNLPGLKCAQAVVNNDVDEARWRAMIGLKSHGASTLGIAANVAAYRDGGPWLDTVLGHLDRNRRLLAELLREHLPEVGYVVPEATYLAWLDFRALGLPEEPADFFLARARVALNPGRAFGANGAGHARLNFATTRAILEQAVTAMGAAVRGR